MNKYMNSEEIKLRKENKGSRETKRPIGLKNLVMWGLVTMAWCVLGLQMEDTASSLEAGPRANNPSPLKKIA
jgi:hypothetical protein